MTAKSIPNYENKYWYIYKSMTAKSIPNYENKYWYIYKRQGGLCVIGIAKEKEYKMDSLHHRLHNTKVNRKCVPLFVHSILNLAGVSGPLHLVNGSFGSITPYRAGKIEAFLQRHPKISEWVNNPVC